MLFADNEKLIFGYDLGTEKRYADPLEIRRKLIRSTGGEFNEVMKDAWRPAPDEESRQAMEDPTKLEAQEKIVASARDAFDLPPVDPKTGGGVPESEVNRVLFEFLRWVEKNGN